MGQNKTHSYSNFLSYCSLFIVVELMYDIQNYKTAKSSQKWGEIQKDGNKSLLLCFFWAKNNFRTNKSDSGPVCCPTRNHTTLHDHVLLVTFSLCISRLFKKDFDLGKWSNFLCFNWFFLMLFLCVSRIFLKQYQIRDFRSLGRIITHNVKHSLNDFFSSFSLDFLPMLFSGFLLIWLDLNLNN